ncbi:RICIN domain-containing protein [Kitasatospora sp. NPDC091257]|uniref:RICIN domain-containing protein n=1 Tax=Kitasatospora sp. NPDC091257 TaxID=3364084 RepID=UPI00380F711A
MVLISRAVVGVRRRGPEITSAHDDDFTASGGSEMHVTRTAHKCLSFHAAFGKHVGAYPCVGYSDQRFELRWPGNNLVDLYNMDYKSCLNIYTLEGSEVEGGYCGNLNADLHVEGSLNPGNIVKLYILYDGTKYCLDYNTEVLSWRCHTIDRQEWEVLSG